MALGRSGRGVRKRGSDGPHRPHLHSLPPRHQARHLPYLESPMHNSLSCGPLTTYLSHRAHPPLQPCAASHLKSPMQLIILRPPNHILIS
eukprot:scaffold1902_cov118-Isochrysis_galbana.AAC.3